MAPISSSPLTAPSVPIMINTFAEQELPLSNNFEMRDAMELTGPSTEVDSPSTIITTMANAPMKTDEMKIGVVTDIYASIAPRTGGGIHTKNGRI